MSPDPRPLNASHAVHTPPDVHGGPDQHGVPLHDFSTNSNACGPCPTTLIAVQAADATRYPDPRYVALRESLADFHDVDTDRIVVAASASEFIFRITAAMAQRGCRKVFLPTCSYGDYATAAHAWQLPVQRDLPVGEDATTPLIWRCDPSSPLGQIDDGLPALIDGLGGDAVCVVDLAYAPLRLTGSPGLDPRRIDRVWQLWTPNKALGLTGIRAAYAIAPSIPTEVAAIVGRLAPSWPVGAHGVAMLESWVQPETRQWIAESLITLGRWKESQRSLCAAMDWHCLPSATNFFCARPPVNSVDALCHAFRLQGIKLRDSTSFGLPHHVRLATLPPPSQAALYEAWQSIALATR